MPRFSKPLIRDLEHAVTLLLLCISSFISQKTSLASQKGIWRIPLEISKLETTLYFRCLGTSSASKDYAKASTPNVLGRLLSICAGLIDSILSVGLFSAHPTPTGTSGTVSSDTVLLIKTTGVLGPIQLCGITSIPVTTMLWILSMSVLRHSRYRSRCAGVTSDWRCGVQYETYPRSSSTCG